MGMLLFLHYQLNFQLLSFWFITLCFKNSHETCFPNIQLECILHWVVLMKVGSLDERPTVLFLLLGIQWRLSFFVVVCKGTTVIYWFRFLNTEVFVGTYRAGETKYSHMSWWWALWEPSEIGLATFSLV